MEQTFDYLLVAYLIMCPIALSFVFCHINCLFLLELECT